MLMVPVSRKIAPLGKSVSSRWEEWPTFTMTKRKNLREKMVGFFECGKSTVSLDGFAVCPNYFLEGVAVIEQIVGYILNRFH